MERLFKETSPSSSYNNAEYAEYTTTSCTPVGTRTVYSTDTGIHSYSYSWKEGWALRDFHKRKNAGELLPATPWKQYQWSCEASPSTRQFCHANGRFGRWEGTYYSKAGFWVDPTYEELYALIEDQLDLEYFVQQAASRIASGGWDTLTFVAELHHLRKMFSNIVNNLHKLTDGEGVRDWHNLWLEGRYGWRTLLYDIRDLSEALEAENAARTRYRHSSGFSTSFTIEDTVLASSPQQIISYSTAVEVSQRGTVVADIWVSPFRINPVVTAWEVTRLSFVLDWLVNVGQALDTAFFLLGNQGYSASPGFRADFVGTQTREPGDPGTYTNYTMTGSSRWEGFIEQRVPQSVSALPRLRVRLDTWKAIDLLALVLQRILK